MGQSRAMVWLFQQGVLMFRVRTTAFTLTGQAEVAMPDGTLASISYRLAADKCRDGCGVILQGKAQVIDHVLRHHAVSLQVAPELKLNFKYAGQDKNRPRLIYTGANPLKKRRRVRVRKPADRQAGTKQAGPGRKSF